MIDKYLKYIYIFITYRSIERIKSVILSDITIIIGNKTFNDRINYSINIKNIKNNIRIILNNKNKIIKNYC